MKDEVTAFQLGSSTVITLPKDLGVSPGQKLTIKKEKQKITLKPQKKLTPEQVHKMVEKLSGGLNLRADLTPEQMKKLLEESYE